MSSPEPDLSAAALRLAGDLERAVAEGGAAPLSPAALQALMAALCRAYGAQAEAGDAVPLLAQPNLVSSTDVMTVTSALLKAANLQVFELGMWQSWTGR